MRGKGLVVCTFDERAAAASDRAQAARSPFHNITTRLWDGRHVAGKAGSFHGVLVDALSSGIGSWRRNPDVRWTIFADQIPELAAQQLQWLDVASSGVRPGGTLVYTVATVTGARPVEVVNAFLEVHPDSSLSRFLIPLEDAHDQRYSSAVAANSRWRARFIARMTRVATPSNPTSSNAKYSSKYRTSKHDPRLLLWGRARVGVPWPEA